jgi:hypothetical protein
MITNCNIALYSEISFCSFREAVHALKATPPAAYGLDYLLGARKSLIIYCGNPGDFFLNNLRY